MNEQDKTGHHNHEMTGNTEPNSQRKTPGINQELLINV